MSPVHVLLVSGSLRGASTNAALMRTAVAAVVDGVTTELFDGMAELPHFNPDDDAEEGEVPAPVAALRERLGHEIYRLPAAWVNAAGLGRGVNADESLRKVLGYVNADVVEAAVARIPVAHGPGGEDGTVADPEVRAGIAAVLEAHVRARRADPGWVGRPAA